MKIGPTYLKDQEKIKIKKCLIALYPDTEILSMAVREKIDLLFTYMIPEIWNFNQITDEFYKKLEILLENRIYLYIIPKEWNYVNSGLLDIISEVLNLKVIDVFQNKVKTQQFIPIGRICQGITQNKLVDLIISIKQKLDLPSLTYLGDLDSPVQRVSIIIGHPLTPKLLQQAKKMNIDTIICENFLYTIEKIAEEFDINLIAVTKHIVNLGLLKLSQALRMEHLDITFIFMHLKTAVKTF